MLIFIKSRSCSKLGHVGSKTKSLGQILEKPFVHSREHSLEQKFMNLFQNVKDDHTTFLKFKTGHVGSKTRSLGQILEKPCVHSIGQSFDPKFMKLCQNVKPHNMWVKFETGSCCIKN